MAKKGAPAALQTEVNTDEDWEKVLQRKGLVLVDVFSDWSGPCVAMVSTLKKIKMEVGGDYLSYAIARNDNITALERFRGKSEPVWLFVENGMMVNLMFGAHCPRLQRLLMEELRRVQTQEPPKWQQPANTRGPEEQARFAVTEEIRLAKEAMRVAKENAEKKRKYETMLDQMMLELCEETALLLFPWIFRDEEGNLHDKDTSPGYAELVHDLFEQCFDVAEEVSLLLDEQLIADMFVESNYDITEDVFAGLTEGKCMIMRLKGRPPHPDWPVTYPSEVPEGVEKDKWPVRKINDVENYLMKIIYAEPPPLLPKSSGAPAPVRMNLGEPYAIRYVHVHEPDPEVEDDVRRLYPGVWVPPQARSKVHVFKTIFHNYMEKAHRYEEQPEPPPLACFKFEAARIKEVTEAYNALHDAIENFCVFERDKCPYKCIAATPEDFENKVKNKTGQEVMVVIIRRVNEEAFLSFAGIEPYYVTEDEDEVEEQTDLYFPEGYVVVDVFEEEQGEGEDLEEEEEEVEEEEEEEEDEDEDQLDLSQFVL